MLNRDPGPSVQSGPDPRFEGPGRAVFKHGASTRRVWVLQFPWTIKVFTELSTCSVHLSSKYLVVCHAVTQCLRQQNKNSMISQGADKCELDTDPPIQETQVDMFLANNHLVKWLETLSMNLR